MMGSRRQRLSRAAPFVAPVFLIVLASVHQHLVQTEDLSRWPGMSFGMFSAVDASHTRFVRVTMWDGDDGEPYALGSSHLDEHALVLAVPSRANAGALATAVLEGAPADADRVVVDVFAVAYDDDGPVQIEAVPLVSVTALR
jgi:hypothetical protein